MKDLSGIGMLAILVKTTVNTNNNILWQNILPIPIPIMLLKSIANTNTNTFVTVLSGDNKIYTGICENN